MKTGIVFIVISLFMVVAACGSNTSGTAMSEEQATSLIMTGTGAQGDDLNSEITKAIAQKVEEELNANLEDPELQAALAEAETEAEEGYDIQKDVRVGFGSKGLTVFIEDEEIPFAGGSMLLNGEVGLRLRIKAGWRIDVVASGELTSLLKDVKRVGTVEGLPYSLSLDGSNKMNIDGTFSVVIKSWKIKSMTADIVSKITQSNVIATGTIADKGVTGTVNMMDVGLRIANPDILKDADNFSVKCFGDIETLINGSVISSCALAESCLSCQ